MSGRRIDFYEVASGHEVGIDHYRMFAFSLHHANSATIGVVDRDIRKLIHLEVSQANHVASLCHRWHQLGRPTWCIHTIIPSGHRAGGIADKLRTHIARAEMAR